MNNFNEYAEIIINSAPGAYARKFAEALVAQINARGTEWIEAHTTALHINFSASEDDAMTKRLGVASIAQQRNFYLREWQRALAA
jgi:hypothetical protein